MGYSRNNTLHSNTDDWGVIIDGCGNTHEKKFYYNGIWTDLCGMSIEDYIKPVTPGGVSGKSTNPIKVEMRKTAPNYTVIASSMMPVASDIVIDVMLNDGSTVKLTIPTGFYQSNSGDTKIPMYEQAPKVQTIEHSPKNDDSFDYIVNNPSPIDDGYNIIHTCVSESEVVDGTINEKFIREGKEEYIDIKNNGYFTVTIPKIQGSEVYTRMSPIKNAIILCIPKEIYEKNKYLIYEGELNNVTEYFLPLSNTYINKVDGLEYIILCATSDGTEYASKTSDREIKYKIINNI